MYPIHNQIFKTLDNVKCEMCVWWAIWHMLECDRWNGDETDSTRDVNVDFKIIQKHIY